MTRRDDELRRILEAERLADDGPEMKEIRRVRGEVEDVLSSAFGTTGLSIRYGGSKAKGMMLKSSYDLDLLTYFHRDNDRAGGTLPEIYKSVSGVLERSYSIEPRTTAIRLYAKSERPPGLYLHVDVVPGRFIDGSMTKVFLHQEGSEQDRLMTDPDEHIRFVRDSGVVDGVCVLKLWRVKNGLLVRQFPFEILSISLLKPHKHLSLADQVTTVLADIAAMSKPLRLEDPGNPSRDLSSLLSDDIWSDLHTAAEQTAERLGWASFSDVLMTEPVAGGAAVAAAAKSVHVATKPWCV